MYHIKMIVTAALFMITVSIISTVTPRIAHPPQIRFNTTASKCSSMIINSHPIMLINLVSKPSPHEISTTSSRILSTIHVSSSVHTNNAQNSTVPVIPLSAAERDKVERVVMASCGELDNPLMAEANAQVILDRVSSGLFGNNLTPY